MSRSVGDEMSDWKEGLKAQHLGEVRWNEPLCRHTTFRIGGPCAAMVLPKTIEQAAAVLAYARQNQVPFCVLGSGSNVLAADEGYDGLIIKLGGQLKQLTIAGQTLRAEAGLPLPVLAHQAAAAGLAGLAFAAGIPGTVGGAVVMNAGAHGGQMSDIIQSVTFCDEEGQIVTIPAKQAGFVYRSSAFKNRAQWTVLAVDCQLKTGNAQEILAQMAAYQQERLHKQPQGLPSAGSVFKNPPGDAAGRLIEAIGAKGWRVGDAQVSEVHSNFIVNLGQATCADVLALAAQIQEAVWQQFGLKLEREIVVLR